MQTSPTHDSKCILQLASNSIPRSSSELSPAAMSDDEEKLAVNLDPTANTHTNTHTEV